MWGDVLAGRCVGWTVRWLIRGFSLRSPYSPILIGISLAHMARAVAIWTRNSLSGILNSKRKYWGFSGLICHRFVRKVIEFGKYSLADFFLNTSCIRLLYNWGWSLSFRSLRTIFHPFPFKNLLPMSRHFPQNNNSLASLTTATQNLKIQTSGKPNQ